MVLTGGEGGSYNPAIDDGAAASGRRACCLLMVGNFLTAGKTLIALLSFCEMSLPGESRG